MKILVIEDEIKVAGFLKEGLEEQNYRVDVAYDGRTGEKLAIENEYDIILLDIKLPFKSGIEICRRIREVKETPVLMLTALGTTDDKLAGFESGADDYIVKPFEFKELLARITALTKRSRIIYNKSKNLKIADLELDVDKKVAKRAGKMIELTAKEYSLLEFLMKNYGRVLSRSELAEHVWEITFDTGTNVVDVYINLLRKKIEKNFNKKLIHTRVGLGYIFMEE